MSELEGQHFIGRSFSHDDGVQLVSIHDENGMWVLDCFESGSEEILKRINGYPELGTKLHHAMQELNELVTKREMVRRQQQREHELVARVGRLELAIYSNDFNVPSYSFIWDIARESPLQSLAAIQAAYLTTLADELDNDQGVLLNQMVFHSGKGAITSDGLRTRAAQLRLQADQG